MSCWRSWPVLALLVALFPGGCRLIAAYDPGTPQDGAHRPTDSAQVDRRADGPTPDAGPGDLSGPDIMEAAAPDSAYDAAPSDLPDSLPLLCTKPSLAGSNPPAGSLYEVALRTDGKFLIAVRFMSPTTWYQTTRNTRNENFRAWKAIPPTQDANSPPLDANRDPSFFDVGSNRYLITANNVGTPGARSLHLFEEYQDPGNARISWVRALLNPITMTDGVGKTIDLDIDGPQVVVLPGNNVLMAHNVTSTKNHNQGQIYLAKPTNSGDLSAWTTKPVFTPSVEGRDDPALSPDGLVLLFSASGDFQSASGDIQNKKDTNGIWVSRRASINDLYFPNPVLLSDVNTAGDDGDPYFASLNASGSISPSYELFFTSDLSPSGAKTLRRVYRTTCGP